MPKRKTAKPRPHKKRTGKKRVVKARNSTSVGMEISARDICPLPLRLHRKLLYSETMNFTTGLVGTVGTTALMILNNIYDPNFSGVGHQPYGFDQIKVFYELYRVRSCKVTLIWSTIGGTADVLVCYQLRQQTGGLTISGLSVDSCTEKPFVGTSMLSASGSKRTVEQNVTVNIPKVMGLTKAEYDDAQYQGNTTGSSNPIPSYIEIGIASPSQVAAEAATCQIIMEYDCEFFGRIVLPGS